MKKIIYPIASIIFSLLALSFCIHYILFHMFNLCPHSYNNILIFIITILCILAIVLGIFTWKNNYKRIAIMVFSISIVLLLGLTYFEFLILILVLLISPLLLFILGISAIIKKVKWLIIFSFLLLIIYCLLYSLIYPLIIPSYLSNVSNRPSVQCFEVEDFPQVPSKEDPVVFSPNQPEIKEKTTKDIQIGFYNPSTSNSYWCMGIFEGRHGKIKICGGSNNSVDSRCYDNVTATYRNKPFKLQKNNTVNWNVTLEPQEKSVPTGYSEAYLLTVKFFAVEAGSIDCTVSSNLESYQKELFLTVRK